MAVRRVMSAGRLEAFSDGVLAIIITIMVLELHAPAGGDVGALAPLLPVFLSYVLSFTNIGIYWNNHHQLVHAVDEVNGLILWANLHLLFWLSLIPFATAWMGENHYRGVPTSLYGAVLLCCGFAFLLLQEAILRTQRDSSALREAIGRDAKGRLSLAGYIIALPVALWQPWAAQAIYIAIALAWLVPDRRLRRAEGHTERAHS